MYAIAFDLVLEDLRNHYSATSPQNAYAEVRVVLEEAGFLWRQGSVYFGEPTRVDAVACVLVAQRLANELPWFSRCVRDIRMLRIEENNDLGPAIARP
jgi:virulence-associated protein VapD